jgi:hypothetical protein
MQKNGETSGLPHGFTSNTEKPAGFQPDRVSYPTRPNEYSNGYAPGEGVKYEGYSQYPGDPPGASYDPRYGEKFQNDDYSRQYQGKYDEGKLVPSSYPDNAEVSNYQEEIERIRQQIKRKENELSYIQQTNLKPGNLEPESYPYFEQNREPADRRLFESRKVNSSVLNEQINEKIRAKAALQMEKEKETLIRLEAMKKIKDDEASEKFEKARKAREYREQLEAQNFIKSSLKQQERVEVGSQQLKNTNTVISTPFPPNQRFTRSSPKTAAFNPITGVLLDASNDSRGYENTSKPLSDNASQASSSLSQGIRFTRNNPKVVQSFPITGYAAGYEWKPELEAEFSKVGDKHMAGYGQRLIQGNRVYG